MELFINSDTKVMALLKKPQEAQSHWRESVGRDLHRAPLLGGPGLAGKATVTNLCVVPPSVEVQISNKFNKY